MRLPSQKPLDVLPEYIDPSPIPETKKEARFLVRLMELGIRLAVPREAIERRDFSSLRTDGLNAEDLPARGLT